MAALYDHVCSICKTITEDNNPSPPLCPYGHGLMKRKFTPLAIKVKGGTPRFHQNKEADKKAKWKDDRSEQEHQDRQEEVELARIDEEAKQDYAAGELSYKHGHGSFDDERQIAREDAAKGEPHGPGEVE